MPSRPSRSSVHHLGASFGNHRDNPMKAGAILGNPVKGGCQVSLLRCYAGATRVWVTFLPGRAAPAFDQPSDVLEGTISVHRKHRAADHAYDRQRGLRSTAVPLREAGMGGRRDERKHAGHSRYQEGQASLHPAGASVRRERRQAAASRKRAGDFAGSGVRPIHLPPAHRLFLTPEFSLDRLQ